MRTNLFCINLLNTPRGPGHPSKISGTSQIPVFETQGRQPSREGTNFSATTPSCGRPQPHLDPKNKSLCSFFGPDTLVVKSASTHLAELLPIPIHGKIARRDQGRPINNVRMTIDPQEYSIASLRVSHEVKDPFVNALHVVVREGISFIDDHAIGHIYRFRDHLA